MFKSLVGVICRHRSFSGTRSYFCMLISHMNFSNNLFSEKNEKALDVFILLLIHLLISLRY